MPAGEIKLNLERKKEILGRLSAVWNVGPFRQSSCPLLYTQFLRTPTEVAAW